MNKEQIHPKGPTFSKIIAGTMKWGIWGRRFNTQQYQEYIEYCLSLGIDTFDHADIYGHYTTEEEFGAAFKQQPNLRKHLKLISKCGIKLTTPNRPSHKIKSYDTSKKHIVESVEQSLKNFHTETIDLLLIHRPSPLMDFQEMAEAFTELAAQGKVQYFGVSNFTRSQFDLFNQYYPLVNNQVEFSVVHGNPMYDGTFDTLIQNQVKPTIWSPLGGGELFNVNKTEKALRIETVAKPLCEKYDCELDQLLLAWTIQHPVKPLPVIGTGNKERIKKAVAASQIQMSREEWFELWEASSGTEVA